MSEIQPGGKIITFYSYKGGTGRSMALSNVAWILAASGKRVLILDWDLEAPGLHRYYRPFLTDKGLTSSEGIIDFVADFADEAIRPVAEGGELAPDWYIQLADITRLVLSVDFEEFPGDGLIDLIPSGRQGTTYATRVNSFNWQNFYDRLGGGAFLEAAKQHMRENYDYVLIDSRTGVSDTAGICTVQMPDVLVVCFTYNNQSIEGAAAVARSAVEGRRKLTKVTGENVFTVLPVPTRVDQSEMAKLQARRKYAWRTFGDLLGPSISDAEKYWLDVEVPYVAYHSYEEVLAAFTDSPNDPKNVLGSLVRLTQQLAGVEVRGGSLPIDPETKLSVLLQFAETPDAERSDRDLSALATETVDEELSRRAESAFNRLPIERHEEARRVWERLVRASRPEDGGSLSRQRVKLKDFPTAAHTLIASLTEAGLLSVLTEQGASEETVEIADEALLRGWNRLRGWVERDLEFLLWRQKLQDMVQDWQRSQQQKDFLLRGAPLNIARDYLNRYRDDLNEPETEFIQTSIRLSQLEDVSRSSRGGRAFIIRPFGVKDGTDFDAVERLLLAPALGQLGVSGFGTIDILEAGNIRLDMFQRLLTADIIIADISINDPNVFYELGIRHALRDKRTFLIRRRDKTIPFELQTDRSFTYDQNNPAASVEGLMAALNQSLNSEVADSPVFLLLPDLKAHDVSQLTVVPAQFREEVERARADRQTGDLSLLAEEVQGYDWEVQGLRLIGRAQFDLRDMRGARYTWEAVRTLAPDDLEANLQLGTIYQRLGDLTRSDQALLRNSLRKEGLDREQRAEVRALVGRNYKTRWKDEWRTVAPPERQAQALRSPYLFEAIQAYGEAFREDLSHYYSGLNQLAMLTIAVELAQAQPDIWEERFETEKECESELDRLKEEKAKVAAAVDLALAGAAEASAKAEGRHDIWQEISRADFLLLTSRKPSRVALAYRSTLVGAPDFATDSVRSQILLYKELGILVTNVDAALSVVGDKPLETEGGGTAASASLGRVLLFTGHTIDAPDRVARRFPIDKEEVARQAIREAVIREIKQQSRVTHGIAGGSNGGDILFHEVCAELNIPTTLYLAAPQSEYISAAVQAAGPGWVERFHHLFHRSQARVLGESLELPFWLREKPDYSVWQRSNLWMFHNALVAGGANTTVIALWDGGNLGGPDQPPSPGETAQILQKASAWGMREVVLNTRELFGQ